MSDESENKGKTRRAPRKATPKYLENSALHYLQRFSTSTANLRRILMRKVERSVLHHDTDPDQGAAMVEALLVRFGDLGYLDDAAYAEMRVRALNRRGAGERAIRARLREKGVDEADVDRGLASLEEEVGDTELSGAVTLARRRRLGPFRTAPPGDEEEERRRRDREMAAFARAGFDFQTARRVMDAETITDLEAMLAEAADPDA
ncbi:MAG: recombination regulator RecX [Rhodospirillales bacterium]|nr:recombination regulator RecX [Rhodospirillales bacterium]MCW8952353.1 recombination regulator RecX [Rhodospirillales bacterium]MCW8971394.1 recombination regulator RecX [Rhodospirillales bacterium]MCW9002037.1 recombination regulator RecX [Rhodospirillales bacterium]